MIDHRAPLQAQPAPVTNFAHEAFVHLIHSISHRGIWMSSVDHEGNLAGNDSREVWFNQNAPYSCHRRTAQSMCSIDQTGGYLCEPCHRVMTDIHWKSACMVLCSLDLDLVMS